MNALTSALLAAGLLLLGLGQPAGRSAAAALAGDDPRRGPPHRALAPPPSDELAAVVERYCQRCHNDRSLRGNLSLERFDPAAPEQDAELAEKVVRKLRAGMMPPPGARRPAGDTLEALALSLETRLDAAATEDPDPGHRTFQRLNRAEYQRAIHDLLGLEIDASAYLPNETFSGGFDNIADVQTLSPTLLEAYLTAAGEVARLALGDAATVPSEATYDVPRYTSQRERVEGAPFGTRGGLSVVHNFPADGDYVFRASLQHESTGNLFGQTAPFDEQLEISIDGARVALLEVDRWMHVQDPNGVTLRSAPVAVTAGPHRVSAAFVKRAEGPLEDLVSPHEWSLADKKIGYSYGITSLPHLRDLAIGGPFDVRGVTDHAVRRRILSCTPSGPAEEAACARAIVGRLASSAFRRRVREADVDALLVVYEEGHRIGGFEMGIRTALQAILASPDFVFRMEEAPGARAGERVRVSDEDLATRLAFFLWASPPDAELRALAEQGRISDPAVLDAQLGRMLDDPRAEALGTRFAAQWLRLQDLDKVHPDALAFPDFHQQLADAMRRETELFFHHLVVEDRSVLELLTADYTFVNERLARHYGIEGVAGDGFRRVPYPDESRRGVLGHGSILTSTSHANRTSPVLRGKWVMEVLLGTPPPPPPPDVPDLEATAEADQGRVLTVRQRLEMHRESPQCRSCHRVIDPIGLALENFDVTGRWRIKDQGLPIDPEGELYDGTALTSPADLRDALLSRPEALVRTFTENLMAYALGRRVEHYDMPTVRGITREAAADGYRLSAFIRGVVHSPAFQWRRVPGLADDPGGAVPSDDPAGPPASTAPAGTARGSVHGAAAASERRR